MTPQHAWRRHIVRRTLRALIAASIGMGAGAQEAVPARWSCLAELPPHVLTRVPVYLTAIADSQSRQILPGVDAFTQLLATRLRALAGAAGNELPPGDSLLTWNELDGRITLTVYRDGRFSWAGETNPERLDSFYKPSTALLQRGLTALREEGERIFVPDDLAFDSLTVHLSYTWPIPAPNGSVPRVTTRLAIPVFSLEVPWEQPAVAVREPRVRYPAEPRDSYAEGRVLLQFIIDTTGRAEMNTVRALGRPQLSGALAEYYRKFVAAAIESLEDARFSPAQIGGCRVRQLVQLPFHFQLRR